MNISEVIAVTELIFHYMTGEASLPVHFFYIVFNTFFFGGLGKEGLGCQALFSGGYFLL
jgi:hypothetical protein